MLKLLSSIGLEEVSETAETTGGGLDGINSFMGIFTIIIGIVLLYSAITGKGPAFRNDYPKSMQAEAIKMMRTFSPDADRRVN